MRHIFCCYFVRECEYVIPLKYPVLQQQHHQNKLNPLSAPLPQFFLLSCPISYHFSNYQLNYLLLLLFIYLLFIHSFFIFLFCYSFIYSFNFSILQSHWYELFLYAKPFLCCFNSIHKLKIETSVTVSLSESHVVSPCPKIQSLKNYTFSNTAKMQTI